MPEILDHIQIQQRINALNIGPLRRIVNWLLFSLTAGSLLISLAGVIVRLTLRDRSLLSAILFYSTPPLVLTALLFFSAGLLFVRKCRKLSTGVFAAGILCLIWTFQTSFYHNSERPPDDSIPVLFWNVSHGVMGWSAIAEEIQRSKPQLIGLVEGGKNDEFMREFWSLEFPDYERKVFDGGLVLLVKGNILKTDSGRLGSRSRFASAEILLDGLKVTVVLVDICSEPWISRREPLEKLTAVLREKNHKPLLLMGDFNTPPDSLFLRGIRRDLVNAFEEAGDGYSATWPIPVPVLTLDQVWVNKGIEVHRCLLGWSVLSDHRPVLSEITLNPGTDSR
ncbi:MAG: endonuclease/exonuclease/phosphatase family protein [Planctomycetes bacterium]|nr:endonuclease/exonuclease/phosphatase family protein [Planctomycetota bacterium]